MVCDCDLPTASWISLEKSLKFPGNSYLKNVLIGRKFTAALGERCNSRIDLFKLYPSKPPFPPPLEEMLAGGACTCACTLNNKQNGIPHFYPTPKPTQAQARSSTIIWLSVFSIGIRILLLVRHRQYTQYISF